MRRVRAIVAVLGCTMTLLGCARPPGPSLADEPAGAAPEPATTSHRPTTIAAASPWPALDTTAGAKVVVTPNGVVLPVEGATDGGWQVRTPCGKDAVVHDARVVSAAHVVIDPGHGGSEVGAVSTSGLRESDLNLAVALDLERILTAEGMQVMLTRYGDYRLPIPTRADIVNALHPRLFISIHHNGGQAARRATPGTETYFQVADAESRRFAGLVWEDVVSALTPFEAQWMGADDAGAIYRKDREGNDFYGVLRRTAGVPSVLVEASYLSNPDEAELLARTDVQNAEANAIAKAVVRYFSTNDAGSGYTEPRFRGYGSSGGGTFANCRDPRFS
jgi:N-acetylmuramoyl-L-alanine amidase